MKAPTYTIKQFKQDFPTEDSCLDRLFKLRFGELKECPKCKSNTTYKKLRGRKCYYCPQCYNQIHPQANTIFHKSSTPLTTWFYAMFLFTKSKNGFSACELERQVGVTYKTSWRILMQIRKLMVEDKTMIDGIVEIDETFVGGKNANRHWDKRVKKSQGRSFKDKVPVLGILQRGGNVSTYVVPNTKAWRLMPIIIEKVKKGSMIMTDEWSAYNQLYKRYNHQFVYHSKGQYCVDGITTNKIENFWSIYKRTIRGSYIKVSKKYLQMYSNEIAFRFNNRDNRDIFNTLFQIIATDWSILANQNTSYIEPAQPPKVRRRKNKPFFNFRPEEDI